MKKIGIDIDGVVADSQPVIIEKLNRHFGSNYTREDFINFKPREMFGLTRDAFDRFIMARELEIILEVVPVPGAAETIRELGENHKIHLISARTPAYAGQTAEWLDRHGIVYDGLSLLGQHDKRGACMDFCVDIFIEDNKKNALQISSCGVPVLLMDATYNRGKLPGLVTRVRSWREIKEHIVHILGLRAGGNFF